VVHGFDGRCELECGDNREGGYDHKLKTTRVSARQRIYNIQRAVFLRMFTVSHPVQRILIIFEVGLRPLIGYACIRD